MIFERSLNGKILACHTFLPSRPIGRYVIYGQPHYDLKKRLQPTAEIISTFNENSLTSSFCNTTNFKDDARPMYPLHQVCPPRLVLFDTIKFPISIAISSLLRDTLKHNMLQPSSMQILSNLDTHRGAHF